MKFSIRFEIESEFEGLAVSEREQVVSDMREDVEEVLSRYRGSLKGFETFSAGELAETALHTFTDTPCGRRLAKAEADLGRLTEGEMVDLLLDNFNQLADSTEARAILKAVIVGGVA